MNLRTLTLVLGSALTVAAGGVSATACSSSSSGGNNNTGHDASASSSGSGSSSGTSSSSGSSSGTSSSSGSSSGGTADAGCGTTPELHADDAGVIYCGFNGDAGALSCPTGQMCCLGGEQGSGNYLPQICATWGQAADCTNGSNPEAGPDNYPAIPIECNQIADCTANGNSGATACCLQGAKGPTAVAGCTYSKASDGTAIVCEGTGGGAPTACQAGEIQICSQNSDCPSATPNCTAGKWKIFQVGFCTQ